MHRDASVGRIRRMKPPSIESIRTPQGSPGGETVSRFFGVCGLRELGLLFKAPQPVKLGLPGFGGASICPQPIVGWRTMTPGDVRACIAVLSRSGRFLRGDQESLCRLEHLFIQPVVLGVAFGSLLRPIALQTSGRDIRHTHRQPAGLPFSPPLKSIPFGVRDGWFAH